MDEFIEKPGGIKVSKPNLESRALYKRCNELLLACEKYQKDDDRLAKWKRLDGKMRGKYPGTKRKVETIASYVYETINTLAPRRPYIRVSAKTPKYLTSLGNELDNIRNARFREGAINQEFNEIKVHRQVKKSLRDGLNPYGFGLVKFGWGFNTTYDSKGKEKVVEDKLWVKRHRPLDYFPGLFATDDEDLPFEIWRFWIPKKKARSMKHWNQEVVEDMAGTTVPTVLYSDQKRDYGADLEMLEVFEINNIEEGFVATFGKHGSDFLEMPKDDPYAFKGSHGAIWIPWPLNDDFYGRSQGEMIEDQADDINESRQQVRNHVKAFPFFVIDYSDNAEDNDLPFKHAPYGAKVNLKSGKPGDLVVHAAPAINKDVYMWGDQARQDSQWVLAKSDMSHGQVDPNEKLGQSSLIAGRENINISGMQDTIAEFYETIADKCGDLLVQFTDGQKWFKYMGEDPHANPDSVPFEQYTATDIMGDFDHKCDIETMSPANNDIKSTVLMNLVTQAVDPNMGEVAEDLKRKYDLSQIVVKAIKLKGVDLEEHKKPQEENVKNNSPYDENKIALDGGLIGPALPGEGPEHLPVHIAVAMATKNEEIARHVLDHKSVEANTPQGVQAQQMQQGASQSPVPIMQGAPQVQGGAPVPAQNVLQMPGIRSQIIPQR